MSDFTSRHPYNAPVYNLPRTATFQRGGIHYRIERLSGMFPKYIALIQYVRGGKRITGVLWTEAYMFADGCSYLWINTTPLFDSLKKEFPRTLPSKIRAKFPCLDKMSETLENYGEINLDALHKATFSTQSYTGYSFFRMDVKEPESLIMDDKTAWAVESLFGFVMDAVNEYEEYKRSRIYKKVSDEAEKRRKAAMPATTVVTLYRLARLGYSLYNGIADNTGDYADVNLDSDAWAGNFEGNNEYMVDYLCSDVNDDSYRDSHHGGDISFCGSGDKYTDNEHNQSLADQWIREAEKRYAKGEKNAGDRAMAKANEYLSRIKKK